MGGRGDWAAAGRGAKLRSRAAARRNRVARRVLEEGSGEANWVGVMGLSGSGVFVVIVGLQAYGRKAARRGEAKKFV